MSPTESVPVRALYGLCLLQASSLLPCGLLRGSMGKSALWGACGLQVDSLLLHGPLLGCRELLLCTWNTSCPLPALALMSAGLLLSHYSHLSPSLFFALFKVCYQRDAISVAEGLSSVILLLFWSCLNLLCPTQGSSMSLFFRDHPWTPHLYLPKPCCVYTIHMRWPKPYSFLAETTSGYLKPLQDAL